MNTRSLCCAGLIAVGGAVCALAAPNGATTAPATQAAVEIKGVPGLFWGKSGETTVCGALAVASTVAGEKIGYVMLMGDSGLAFRARWYEGAPGETKRWCPSSPVGEFPEEMELARKSTGWRLESVMRLGSKDPGMKEFLPQVLTEFAAGRPVLGYDGAFNINLLYGYDPEKKQILSHDYFNGDKVIPIAPEKLPGFMVFLGERGKPLARKDAIVAGISKGVANWDRDGKAESGKKDPKSKSWYLYGRRAYDLWIMDLEDADATQDRALFQPSWWTFDCLHDARHAAAAYLKTAAPDVPEAARPHLLKASEVYAAGAKAGSTSFMTQDSFLGPWTGKKYEAWTPEVRKREVVVLKALRDADEKAITELKAALEKMK